jgi:two-component system phosphate regulon sensor histidine kinase PhoR
MAMTGWRSRVKRLAAFVAVLMAPILVAGAILMAEGWLVWNAGLVAAGLLVLAYLLIGWRMLTGLDRAIDYADRLASGLDQSQSPPGDRRAAGGIGALLPSEQIAAAMRRLYRTMTAAGERNARLSKEHADILHNLPDPLLIVDHNRRISEVNESARALLGSSLMNQDLALAIRHPTLLRAVDNLLSEESETLAVEFTLPGSVSRRLSANLVRLPARQSSERKVIVLLHDITAVRKAEQMRADFVANASHELRTPLATLSGFIETLQGPARNDEAARERFLALMQEQSQRMSRLIEYLLSLSQIETDEHRAPEGEADIEQVLSHVVSILEEKAKQKSMRFNIVCPLSETPPMVVGESDQLVQVFLNLVDNAVKYGRPGSSIRMVIERAGSDIEIAVIDEGEGISRSHLPRLTERFYRVDTARSRALGGTGLGLAIVKHIVKRHRGNLEIESQVGKGSTFRVRLPAAEPRKAVS